MLKAAIGKISVLPACEVKPGDHIPDQDGYIHEVTSTHSVNQLVQLILSDGQVKNLRPATQVYCLDLFSAKS